MARPLRAFSLAAVAGALPVAPAPAQERSAEVVLIQGERYQGLRFAGMPWRPGKDHDCLEGSGRGNDLVSLEELGEGDFTLRLRVQLEPNGHGSALHFGEQRLVLDGEKQSVHAAGPWFGKGAVPLGDATRAFGRARMVGVEVSRVAATLVVKIEGLPTYEGPATPGPVGALRLVPGNGRMAVQRLAAAGAWRAAALDPRVEVTRLQPRIDGAIDRGVTWLLGMQQRDGSFGHDARMYPGGMTALAVYTLLKAGLPLQHPAVQRGLWFLDGIRPEQTYTLALMMMAWQQTGDPAHHPRMRELVQELIAWETPQGYSYPRAHEGERFGDLRGTPDLSNMQFAALAYSSAARAGVEVPDAQWLTLVDVVLDYQEAPRDVAAPVQKARTGSNRRAIAGFGYRNRNGPYGSMTAAGVSVLRLAQLHLGTRLPPEEARRVAAAIQAGTGWLEHNFSVATNPAHGYWTYYYLYTLERAMALCGMESLGPHPWYYLGAQWLVDNQGQDGAWSEGPWYRSEPDTCFAILFLRRAMHSALTGEPPRRRGDLHVSEDRRSDVQIRGTGTYELTLTLSGFGEAVRARHGDAQGRLRVAKVEWLVDGAVAATVPGDPTRPFAQEAYAAQVVLRSRGKHKVTARVHLADAEAASGSAVVEGPGFTVQVDSALEPWMQEAATARQRNLLVGQECVATASSRNGNEQPDHACDGVQATRWVCGKDDAEPALTLAPAAPLRANTVVLSPACSHDRIAGRYDRIRRVEVRVNGEKKPVLVELVADERAPTSVALGRTLAISRLDVRVVEREPGGQWKGHCGFSEIALELRR